MMKTDELIKKNSELQAQLNPENDSYYGDLIVYLRAKGTFKSEAIVEEKAFEFLQDILEAQNEGVSAEEYFGKRPKEVADELIEATPTSIFDFLKIILYAFGAYSVFSLFPALVLPDKLFDLGTFGIVAVYSLLIATLVFWLIGTSVYQKQKKRADTINITMLAVFIVGGVLLSTAIKTPFQFRLAGIEGILIILILLAIVAVLFFRQTKLKRKKSCGLRLYL